MPSRYASDPQAGSQTVTLRSAFRTASAFLMSSGSCLSTNRVDSKFWLHLANDVSKYPLRASRHMKLTTGFGV